MLKRLLKSVLLSFIAFLLFSSVALAAWEYLFPITIVDTSNTTSAYYPVLLGFGGQTLVDASKIASSGNDTNMQIGSTSIKYMMATGNVTAVIPSLPSGGVVTANLYTGYSPEQSVFAIITGSGGYVTVADNSSLELGDNCTIEMSGWMDTDNGTDKNLVYKQDAIKVYISPTVSENVTATIGTLTTASENLRYSADSENSSATQDTWVLLKEITITENIQDAQVKFDIKGSGVGSAVFGKVYKNGVAVGSQLQSNADGTYITVSENLTLSAVIGDEIQAYGYPRATLSAYIKNFRIYFDGTGSSVSVSATGISSEEHMVTTHLNPSLLGIGIDLTTGMGLPSGTGLALNDPLWHDTLTGVTFNSIDSFTHVNTVTGATWGIQGRVFNGTSDYINVGNTVPFTTNNFTVSMWVKFDDVTWTDERVLIGTKYQNNGAVLGWYNSVVGGYLGYYQFVTPAGFANMDARIFTIVPNTWTNLVWVFDRTSGITISAYKDGSFYRSATNALTGSVASLTNLKFPYTSAILDSPMTIGEVQIHNIALLPAEILSNFNATKYQYTVGDQNFNYIASGGVSVPPNSNNWTFLQNNVMPYADNITISVGGTQQLYLAPNTMISGTNIPDRSLNSHNGTIVWGSNSGIALSYGEMTSYESWVAISNITGGFSVPSATMPATWFAAGENSANLPFYDSFSAVAVQTGQPVQSLYALAIIGVAFGVFIGLISFTRSALIAYIAMVAIFAFGSSMTIIPAWIVFVLIVVGVGIMYLYRQVSY